MPGPWLEDNEVHESTSWAAVKPPTVKKESQSLSFVPQRRRSAGSSGRRSSFFFFALFSFLRGLVRFFLVVCREKMNAGRAQRASCPLEVTEPDDGCLGFFLSCCGFLCFQDCRVIRLPRRIKDQVLWMTSIRHLCKVQRCSVSCAARSCFQDSPGSYWQKDDHGQSSYLIL